MSDITTTDTTPTEPATAADPAYELHRGQPVRFRVFHGTAQGWVSRRPDECDETVRVRCAECREIHHPFIADIEPADFRQVSIRVGMRVPADVADDLLEGFLGTVLAQIEEPVAGHDQDGNERTFDATAVVLTCHVDGRPLSGQAEDAPLANEAAAE